MSRRVQVPDPATWNSPSFLSGVVSYLVLRGSGHASFVTGAWKEFHVSARLSPSDAASIGRILFRRILPEPLQVNSKEQGFKNFFGVGDM